jgi:WD40 repeat protein
MDDQRQRWQRGDCLPVEAYLEKYPNLHAAPADLLDLIYHEVVLREEGGDCPRPEEYLRRFPQLREELRRQFEVHRAFSYGRHEEQPEQCDPSAGALAADPRRFPWDKAIVARLDGRVGRIWLWCRRNPGIATLLAALPFVVAGSAIAFTAKGIEVWCGRPEKDMTRLAENERPDQLEIADYQTQFRHAYRAWLKRDIAKVHEFLDACNPKLRAIEWYILKRDPRGVTILPDSTGAAIAGTFGSNGSWLISVQRLFVPNQPAGMVRITDVARGACLRELPGLFEQVALSLDNRRLAAAGNAGTCVWGLESGRELATLPDLTGPIALDPEGKRVIGVIREDQASSLVIADTATGTIRSRLQGPAATIRALAVQPNASRAAVGYDSSEVLLWDLIHGTQIGRFQLPAKESVAALALRPDGGQIVTVGALEHTAWVWDAAGGKEQFKLTNHGEEILSVAYSPDGRRVLTGSRDGRVKLWDAGTGLELMTLHDCHQPIVWVAFSGDGTRLAAACWGGLPSSDILLWDARPLEH